MSRPEEQVGDVPDALRGDPSRVPPEAPISRVIELLRGRPESRMVHVVDPEGRLLGTVSWRSVLRATGARLGARSPGFWSLVGLLRDLGPETARDLMRPPTPVTRDTPLREALLRMEETRQNDLPVVDAEGRLVGEFNAMHLMDVALRVFRKTEADLAEARGRDG